MNARTRRLAIGTAGAAAAALAWFAPSAQDELSLPRLSRPTQESEAAPASRLATLPQREGIGAPAGELFQARSWAPPAPKHVAVKPAEPTAPPNPYKFVGRVVQDGAARIFLAKGERVQEAKAGEALDDGYRVDSITAEHVVLVYEPLGRKDLLSIESNLGADVPVAEQATTRRRRHAASFRAEAE